jgi:hypothetical protein
LFGGEARGAEGAERKGVVALGETEAGGVAHEIAVEVRRGGEVESTLQEDLTRGGFEKVATADDFSDVSEGVVDDAGELIAGEADIVRIGAESSAPDEEVTEVDSGGERLRTGVEVCEGDGFVVGGAETVVGVGKKVGVERSGAAVVVVDVFVVSRCGCGIFVRSLRGVGEVLA